MSEYEKALEDLEDAVHAIQKILANQQGRPPGLINGWALMVSDIQHRDDGGQEHHVEFHGPVSQAVAMSVGLLEMGSEQFKAPPITHCHHHCQGDE